MELKSKKQNLLFQAFFLIPCPPHPCLRSKMEKVIGESISSINDQLTMAECLRKLITAFEVDLKKFMPSEIPMAMKITPTMCDI